MTDTLNWIYTKDHKPSWEECKGKMVVYHRNTWTPQEQGTVNPYRMDFDNWVYIFSEDGVNPFTDRYILIDIPEFIPEPVPCKVCGMDVECIHDPAYTGDPNPFVLSCDGANHNVSFDAPTRAEAIQKWNKWNGG